MFEIVIFKKNQFFPTGVLFILAYPLLGGNFYRNKPNRTWNFFPLIIVPAISVRYLEPFYKEFVLILSGLLTIVRYLDVPTIRDAR